MLKENNFVVNSFLPFNYSVYMCRYVYHESACLWYMYMKFHVFSVAFGFTTNTLFYLYPILRFNNVDWLYLHSLPVGRYCTVIRLGYCTVYLFVCRLIYVQLFVFLKEIAWLSNRLALWFCRGMTWSWQSYFYLNLRFYVFRANFFSWRS